VYRSTLHVGAAAGKTALASRFFTLTFAGEAGVHLNDQRMERPEEARLRLLGYPPIPSERTAVPFAGLSGTLTLFLGGRMSLQIVAGVNDYVASMQNGHRHFIRPFAAVRSGAAFSR
jgi:hypothetical protein